ncbi:MAG: glycogen synthase GlgA [Melioribacteraceae bacterium]|nr:glycogen synthase GlgA [Melioribacteraceae bacterium]MCF8264029.1 glycogen synthase GlgA [Melioribacteraceae bacterium]MCF8412792.1 glycogen synthase GlgA [Melioribacteraceae bacterium]MCF8432551.1 glycogen synthase GlgA [Melioribacteraceae bacterium]
MPPKKLKILYVTSEVVPFVKTGGLADVSSALPQKLQEQGHQVRIVVPKYGAIDERKYKIHEVVRLKDLDVKIGEKDVVFSLRSSFLIGPKVRVQIYFLDNHEYYGSRHSLYADPLTGNDFPDNDERFILLARSVFELILKLGWVPDVIHCNDWQCGLIPAYLKTMFKDHEMFQNIKTLFTIHNLSYQGVFPKATFKKTGLPEELNTANGMIHNGKVNFMKAGLNYSDTINTVSETYAEEICNDEELSSGMHKILKRRKDDVFGIVNGIDDRIWNPSTDKLIEKKYSLKNLDDKKLNKRALSEKFGFDYNPDRPTIGIISRLYDHKGFDLLEKAFPALMKLDLNLILLGTGDKKYHKFFESAVMDYSDKFYCYLGFDDELAHLIEAGSDMYLMPSKYEPCGLNQMYSLMYGTVPIVRETGGLADTVENYDPKEDTGNGFSFQKYDPKELVKTVKAALDIYTNDPKTWTKIMKNGMKSNFTWLNSSKLYVDLYKKVIS